MTTKPEFTKAFCLEHAKAGAPYCCRDGRTAQVLKWDRNVSDYPLLGVMGKSDDPRTWTVAGSTTYGAHGAEYDGDLIMLPLGFIDGKPVWVGDHFITSSGLPCIATTASAGNFKGCSWPAPAPVYPTTLMTINDILDVEHKGSLGDLDAVQAVMNAALRHAIDAGQVVLPGASEARDLAVAQAVKEWCKSVVGEGSISRFFDGIHLPDIIAGVAK